MFCVGRSMSSYQYLLYLHYRYSLHEYPRRLVRVVLFYMLSTIALQKHPYIIWPHKLHFYKVKLKLTEVCIIFVTSRTSAQKHRLWIHVRTAWASSSNEYPQSSFLSRNMKTIRICI